MACLGWLRWSGLSSGALVHGDVMALECVKGECRLAGVGSWKHGSLALRGAKYHVSMGVAARLL